MSASGSKTTQNSTTTSTPVVPQWIQGPIQDQMGRINALAGADPYSFVAPASALQNTAFGLAGGMDDRIPGLFDTAVNTAQGLTTYQPQQVGAGMVSGQSVAPSEAFASFGNADPSQALSAALSGVPNNPYLGAMNQANINQSLQGYNDALSAAAKAMTRSVLPGIRSGGILAGQYGGSRQGIAEGVALGDLGTELGQNARNLAQSAMDSGNQLYGGAYENAQQRAASTATALAGMALQNSQGNADRLQQAQTTNVANGLQAAMANQSAGLQGANLNLNAAQYLGGLGQYGMGALAELGGTQQGLDQAYRQAPLNLAQATSGMFGSLPVNMFTGNTTTSNSTSKSKSGSLSLDDLAKVATFAMSDPRVKRDMEWAGFDPQGRNVYDYNYTFDPPETPPRTGYSADEIALSDPEAVAVGPEGVAGVDYERINAKNEAALDLPMPKAFSDPRVMMSGWTPDGSALPKPFSDPRVMMDGWRPNGSPMPKPFSDLSVLRSGPYAGPLDPAQRPAPPTDFVAALGGAGAFAPRPYQPSLKPIEMGPPAADAVAAFAAAGSKPSLGFLEGSFRRWKEAQQPYGYRGV